VPRAYTTGEIAEICQVTKRTVIKWIDSGKLRGYVLPVSNHRRVAADELRRFMRKHDIPDLKGRLPKRKVLIVDDDPDFLELLRDALSEKFELATAGNALEAASRLPVFEPDVILLDVRLPDLSGLEVCSHFQDYRRTRKAPILVMSAYGHELDLQEVRDRGADDFLPKPLKIRDLTRRIRAMVG
jgi:excisionase family DNA binding protein